MLDDLWVMNSDGSNQRQLTVPAGIMDFDTTLPMWSLDGSKIAYAIREYGGEMTDIYALNVGKPSPVKPPVGETPIEKQPWIPSFEAAFTIAGLLTVAYLLRRR
ncbi:hypothetical protein DRN97_12540 [Methanosarcinales archaeon]|nr:MAG: hypothetical protein DRN97_12540 [Methanosarcinales archaeon]